MYKTAILGMDIGYTRSPEIHAAIAKAAGYENVCEKKDVQSGDLGKTVDDLLLHYDGFYVTKPYKNEVKRYIGCADTGAVNVVRSRDKKAANTDAIGFLLAMDRAFPDWNSCGAALVLGAGGAAWAAVTALKTRGQKVYVLSRNNVESAKLCKATGAELYANQPAELCVNCTSAGTDGDVLNELCVVPSFKYAYEMYYAAPSTPFTERAAKSGSRTATGLDMLVYQAIKGDAFLFDKNFDTERVFETVIKTLRSDK